MRPIIAIAVFLVVAAIGAIEHNSHPPTFQPVSSSAGVPNESQYQTGDLLDFRDTTYSIGSSSVRVDGYILNTGNTNAKHVWVACHASDSSGADHIGSAEANGYIAPSERYGFEVTIGMSGNSPLDHQPSCTVLWKQ
jgi:hypothetical protein